MLSSVHRKDDIKNAAPAYGQDAKGREEEMSQAGYDICTPCHVIVVRAYKYFQDEGQHERNDERNM